MAIPVKVILLLLGAGAYRTASKAPTPPAKNDQVIKETYFDKGPGAGVMVVVSEACPSFYSNDVSSNFLTSSSYFASVT